MKTVTKVLPHISIILSGMLIVFCVIDRFNSAMGFLDNDAAKLMIFALSVFSIINAILLAAAQRRRECEAI